MSVTIVYRNLVAAAFAVALAVPSFAVPAQAADTNCHANMQYSIAARDYEESAGSQYAVTALKGKTAPKACKFNADKADFVIGQDEDPLWFGELKDNLLILTRSTGPQGYLVVYDLAKGAAAPVLDVPSDDYEFVTKGLSYWERVEEATKATCPDFAENEANGLRSDIAAHRIFNLADGAITDTGESKCVAIQ